MPYHKLWRWSKLLDSHINADCYCISSYETYCKVYSYQYWVNNVRISVKVEQYHALMNIAAEEVQQVKPSRPMNSCQEKMHFLHIDCTWWYWSPTDWNNFFINLKQSNKFSNQKAWSQKKRKARFPLALLKQRIFEKMERDNMVKYKSNIIFAEPS